MLCLYSVCRNTLLLMIQVIWDILLYHCMCFPFFKGQLKYNLRLLFVGQLQLMSAYCNMFKHQTVCQNRGNEHPRLSWLLFLVVQLHL